MKKPKKSAKPMSEAKKDAARKFVVFYEEMKASGQLKPWMVRVRKIAQKVLDSK